MKTIVKYSIAILGWLLAGVAFYWGYNRCSGNEQALQSKLKQVELVKQNPVSTFVDSAGREHVKFKDGTVAKLPSNPQKQKLYTMLRDSIASTMDYLIGDKEINITEVSKVTTKTTGSVKKEVLDSLPSQQTIKLDDWMTLFADNSGGFKYQLRQKLNTVRHTENAGLFGLRQDPYITFYTENPNSTIEGYEKYSIPLPVYKPRFKVYTQADYNFTTQNPSADLGISYRIGKVELGGFGRLDFNLKNTITDNGVLINGNTVTPGYGARIRYNIVEQ